MRTGQEKQEWWLNCYRCINRVQNRGVSAAPKCLGFVVELYRVDTVGTCLTCAAVQVETWDFIALCVGCFLAGWVLTLLLVICGLVVGFPLAPSIWCSQRWTLTWRTFGEPCNCSRSVAGGQSSAVLRSISALSMHLSYLGRIRILLSTCTEVCPFT